MTTTLIPRIRRLGIFSGIHGAYVLDKDGTLLNQHRPIEGASEFLSHLKSHNIPFVILTNTGEKTPAQVVSSLTKVLGLPEHAVEEGHIITARQVVLQKAHESTCFHRMFVLGKIEDDDYELFDWRRTVPKDASGMCLLFLSDGMIDNFVRVAECVGKWIRNGACLWASSADDSISTASGAKRPGPGAFLASVRCLLSSDESLSRIHIFGKGGNHTTEMSEQVMQRLREQGFQGTPRQVLAVGDRFDCDVSFGKTAGWSTCLVETGCHQLADAARFRKLVADRVATSVGDLMYLEDESRPDTSAPRSLLAQVIRTAHCVATCIEEETRQWRQEWLETLLDRLHGLVERLDQSARDTMTGPPQRVQSCPDLTELPSAYRRCPSE